MRLFVFDVTADGRELKFEDDVKRFELNATTHNLSYVDMKGHEHTLCEIKGNTAFDVLCDKYAADYIEELYSVND